MNDESFFRRAWLTLKATSPPAMRKKMDALECAIEGMTLKDRTQKKESNDRPKLTRV